MSGPTPPEPTAPRLNGRGRAVVGAGVALLFVAATAGAPWVAGAGATLLALAVLALGWGRRTARALDALRLEWDAPVAAMRPMGEAVRLTLRVASGPGAPLRGLAVSPVVSGPATAEATTLRLFAPAGAEAHFAVDVRPSRAGLWRVWGFALSAGEPLGLADAARWHSLPLFLHAGPRRLDATAQAALLKRIGAVRDREGRHLDRQNGSGLELRELRDYVPGDPLKAVAWKASARRGRWLVRAYEDESMRRFQVVVAIGPEMRVGDATGEAPLDRAIDHAAHLIALAHGERVGLTTFDHRVVAHIRPDTGRAHAQRLLQQLLDVTRVVDADLTEIADAELFARVGELLERQAGLSLRRVPHDLSRLAQAEVLTDPVRELYDESAVFTHVSRALAAERDRGRAALFGKSRPAADLASARLRLYCALNAIPLPYRLVGPPDAFDNGLAAALSRNLLTGGAETLVVLADVTGLAADGPAIRTLRHCHARKRTVVLVPLGAPPSATVLRALQASGARLHEAPPVRPPRRGPAVLAAAAG